MTATRARKQISKFLRNPIWFAARHVAKANPSAASVACQGLERKIVTGILFCVKKPPAFGRNGWFFEQPIFVIGFNRRILFRRICEKALDGLAPACGCRGVVGPAASSHLQKS